MIPWQQQCASEFIQCLQRHVPGVEAVPTKSKSYQLRCAGQDPLGAVRCNTTGRHKGMYTVYAYRPFFDPQGRFRSAISGNPDKKHLPYFFYPSDEEAMTYAIQTFSSRLMTNAHSDNPRKTPEWHTTRFPQRTSAKRACKPDSVPRERGGGHLSGPPVAGRDRAAYPGTAAGRCAPQSGDVPLFGLAPGGVCQHPGLRRDLVRSYRTVSRLPVPRVSEAIGAVVSVALSVASLRLGVTQHPALWSPDFPPRRRRSGRPALLTSPVYACRNPLTRR